MRYLFLFCLSFLVFTTSLEAQWVARGPRRCWCCCYMDPTYANYDCNYYGYVDNINYPDRYDLPINRCFNYCLPCPCNSYDSQYFQKCVRYTRQRAYSRINTKM